MAYYRAFVMAGHWGSGFSIAEVLAVLESGALSLHNGALP